MSETKFTEGEQVVTDTYSNYIYDVVRVGNFDIKTKSEADARLMAAAPEMYEFLDGIVDGALDESDNRELRALLAKARGEL